MGVLSLGSGCERERGGEVVVGCGGRVVGGGGRGTEEAMDG